MAAAVRLHRRRGRSEAEQALLEGPVVVGEAAASGASLETIFATEDDEQARRWSAESGARLVTVTQPVLARISTTSSPQSPVAVMAIPPATVPADGHVLVAWGLADPGNVGAMIRIAAAFGMGYCAGPDTADTWSPKVVRAATGCHFKTALGRVAGIAELRGTGGREIVAAVPRGGPPPEPMSGAAALLIGSEAHGLPDEVVAASDRLVSIPIAEGVESLNAASAAAIIAHVVVGGRP